MAVRVTAAEVQAIIEVDTTVVTDFDPFITVANQLVDDQLSSLTEYSGTTGAERLKEIERWLAAHFVAIMDMRAASEKAGPVGDSKQYKLGLNLQVTMYGQQACTLDTTGTLFLLSTKAKKKASMHSVNVSKTWATGS